METPNEVIDHIYFPERGIVSVLAQNDDEQLEVGIVGPEGMTGLAVVHGTDRSTERTFVQISCVAWKISVQELRQIMKERAEIRDIFLLYSRAQVVQIVHSALAYGRFSIESRLARWILMSQDRVQSEDIPLTHEFLSLMLGSRRAGVTVAVHILEGIQAIRAKRGLITVRDREKLMEAADGSYGVPEREYERLLGKSAIARPAYHQNSQAEQRSEAR